MWQCKVFSHFNSFFSLVVLHDTFFYAMFSPSIATTEKRDSHCHCIKIHEREKKISLCDVVIFRYCCYFCFLYSLRQMPHSQSSVHANRTKIVVINFEYIMTKYTENAMNFYLISLRIYWIEEGGGGRKKQTKRKSHSLRRHTKS